MENSKVDRDVQGNYNKEYSKGKGIMFRNGLVIFFIIIFIVIPSTIFPCELPLSWIAPTTYSDGTPLNETDLSGYRIYYGTASGEYSNSIDVDNITAYCLQNLPCNTTFYIAATSLAINGDESVFSNEISKTDGTSSCTIISGGTGGGTDNRCGNSIIEGTEGCDDGNNNSGDGCNFTCVIETGWTCSGQPSSCTATGVSRGSDPNVCSGVSTDCGSYLGEWADLYECNLTGVDFYLLYMDNACMHGAVLVNADLTGASFYKVDLSYADFTGANMYYTDMTNANLTNANLSGATNISTITWWNTTCPDGTSSNEHGNTCIRNLR